MNQEHDDDAERWSELAKSLAIMAIIITVAVVALSVAFALGRWHDDGMP